MTWGVGRNCGCSKQLPPFCPKHNLKQSSWPKQTTHKDKNQAYHSSLIGAFISHTFCLISCTSHLIYAIKNIFHQVSTPLFPNPNTSFICVSPKLPPRKCNAGEGSGHRLSPHHGRPTSTATLPSPNSNILPNNDSLRHHRTSPNIIKPLPLRLHQHHRTAIAPLTPCAPPPTPSHSIGLQGLLEGWGLGLGLWSCC